MPITRKQKTISVRLVIGCPDHASTERTYFSSADLPLDTLINEIDSALITLIKEAEEHATKNGS